MPLKFSPFVFLPFVIGIFMCVRRRVSAALSVLDSRAMLATVHFDSLNLVRSSYSFLFDVLLTVHLSIILVINQFNAQILVL